MPEHKHDWTATKGLYCGDPYVGVLESDGKLCSAYLSGAEITRRLNAFDALVEALDWTTTTLCIMQETFAERGSPPSNAPTIAGLITHAASALRLARGESEMRE